MVKFLLVKEIKDKNEDASEHNEMEDNGKVKKTHSRAKGR